MENGYENFVDTLRQSLLKETSYEEEMICYKKAEEYPPTSGDRLLLKNRQKEGVYEVCALYVRDLYDEFQNGWSMENIIQEIMKRLDTLARSECFEKSKNLDSYEMQFFEPLGILHWYYMPGWENWMDVVPALK